MRSLQNQVQHKILGYDIEDRFFVQLAVNCEKLCTLTPMPFGMYLVTSLDLNLGFNILVQGLNQILKITHTSGRVHLLGT